MNKITEDFDVFGLTPDASLDVGDIPMGSDFLLYLKNALDRIADGQLLEVVTSRPEVKEDLQSWCKSKQHQFVGDLDSGDRTNFLIRKGKGSFSQQEKKRWGEKVPVREAGNLSIKEWFQGHAGKLLDEAPYYFGFVPRGSIQEEGAPILEFPLDRKKDVWAENLIDLYEQAKASQWNASRDIPWEALPELAEPLERAVCQLMTFLAENEYSALYIPAKFMARIHPYYIEVMMYLSTLVQDESRHIEAFTKRALAGGMGMQYSSALTQRSLHSLFIQEDYFKSSFLLHVLGEGTFLDLLNYIYEVAPDEVTKKVVHLAKIDEGRHVAYGIYHVRGVLEKEPQMVEVLVQAADERKAYMDQVGGENSHVLEALAILAGGGNLPVQLKRGRQRVRELQEEMHEHRIQRMIQIGISREIAEHISTSHTPNFM